MNTTLSHLENFFKELENNSKFKVVKMQKTDSTIYIVKKSEARLDEQLGYIILITNDEILYKLADIPEPDEFDNFAGKIENFKDFTDMLESIGYDPDPTH